MDFTEESCFLRSLSEDWDRVIDSIGVCTWQPRKMCPYQALIHAVSRQQLAGRVADVIFNRMLDLFPNREFPQPEQLLALKVETLRTCGFSERKIAAMHAIASGALTGLVPDWETVSRMPADHLITRLVTIKGVGRWTVEMILIDSIGHPDIFPAGDLGIQEGYRAMKSLEKSPSPSQLTIISQAWSTYRSVASWYLWRVPRKSRNLPIK